MRGIPATFPANISWRSSLGDVIADGNLFSGTLPDYISSWVPVYAHAETYSGFTTLGLSNNSFTGGEARHEVEIQLLFTMYAQCMSCIVAEHPLSLQQLDMFDDTCVYFHWRPCVNATKEQWYCFVLSAALG